MAAAANAAVGGGEGRGDAGVEEIARQLGDLNVGDQPQPALQRPQSQPINTEGRRFVYFDLETTGLGHKRHITQIAARSGENETFSTFVLPKEPIHKQAQEITGITCKGEEMCHHGNPVPCLRIKPALEGFINFLADEPVILIGHNIRNFDCPILLNALQRCNLAERFQALVHGCMDTLPLFRAINLYADNYKLGTLYQYYTGNEFNAHDAREDVQALQQTVNEASPDHEDFHPHSFTFDYIIEIQRYNAEKAKLLPAWVELVRRGVISKFMADRASGSGLSWNEVVRIFQANGEEGVRRMLRKRLTDRNKIIDSICQYLRG